MEQREIQASPRASTGGAVNTGAPGNAGNASGINDGAAAVVNLTGRTVDCIKTPDRCDEILRSRVESVSFRTVDETVIECDAPQWHAHAA